MMLYTKDKVIKKLDIRQCDRHTRLVNDKRTLISLDRHTLRKMTVWVTSVLLSFGVLSTLSLTVTNDAPLNNRPIIGVLSQELSPKVSELYNANYTSYIAASYVKYLEGAGARVVPIWINRNNSYYSKLIYSLNGVLFPGGATLFTDPGGYAEAGAIIYNLAVTLNKNGDYFPLWGTCLGFELMTYVAAGEREHRCDCWSNNQALPLEFKTDYSNSKLFKSAPPSIVNILSTQDVTANFHQYCVTEKNMTEFGLSRDWHILSTNHDLNGLEFVSTIESRQYPFYATMFHPEKNGYEWKATKNNPHTSDAISIMQYFADFFVDEARKSSHSFKVLQEEQGALIYNYPPTYTGDHLIFEQCYFFTK